jgi:hypothetical protein
MKKSNSESKIDPMVRDKKSLPLSGLDVYPSFIARIIALPIWACTILPIAVLSVGVANAINAFSPLDKKIKASQDSPDESIDIADQSLRSANQYDLVSL